MTQTEQNELRLLHRTSREFSQKVVLPGRMETDKFPDSDMNRAVFEKAYGMDLFHLWLPEKMGGLDGHIGKLCTILLNIAEVDASMAMSILATMMSQEIMIQAGEYERLGELYVTHESFKDALISFASYSNPSETPQGITACQKNDSLCLSGTAKGMVLGNMAGHMIVSGQFEGDSDVSYFLVTAAHETVEPGDPVITLGMRGCPMVDVRLNETPGTLIGKRGSASVYFAGMCEALFPAGASIATGIMRGSFNDALDYTRTRIQGGKKIGHWSEVQLILANMALKVRNAELLIGHIGASSGKHSDHDRISASLMAFESACDVTSDGIQILGGYGYMEDYSQEKRYRDAQHLQAIFGTSYLKKIHYLNACYPLV